MHTSSGRDSALGGVTGAITHIGLITAITDWRAGTVTEASFTGYARKAITWGAAAATTAGDGRKQSNSADITFDQNTGSNQDVIGWGGWTASTNGTLKSIGLFGADAPIVGFVTASADTISAVGHGLVADQRVFFMKAPMGAAPDVFAENTAYYVLSSGLTADVFKLAATSGGTAINPTTDGVGLFIPYVAQTVAANAVVSLAAGQVSIEI